MKTKTPSLTTEITKPSSLGVKGAAVSMGVALESLQGLRDLT